MTKKENDIFYQNSLDVTGTISSSEETKVVAIKFGIFDVKLRLTLNDKFIEIVEIKFKKSFIEEKRSATPKSFHDVEEYYKEDQ